MNSLSPFSCVEFIWFRFFCALQGAKFAICTFFPPATVPVRTRSAVCFRHVFECGLWRSIIAVLQFTLLIRYNAFLSEALVSVSV